MIIKEISLTKQYVLFGTKELTVLTDQGVGKVRYPEPLPNLKDINDKLRELDLKTAEDFKKIKEKIPTAEASLLRALELATFNAQEKPHEFFSKDIKQVPRPMQVLLRKDNGTEFLTLSLDARGFDKAALANEQAKTELKKTINNPETTSTDAILEALNKAITNINLHFDFTLKAGVNFAGQEEATTAAELIEKHKLIYAESPSKQSTPEDYNMLTERFKQTTFICMPLNHGEPQADASNAVLTRFTTLAEFTTTCNTLKQQGVNIFHAIREGEEQLSVALNIPILKLPEEPATIIRTLSKIKDALKKPAP